MTQKFVAVLWVFFLVTRPVCSNATNGVNDLVPEDMAFFAALRRAVRDDDRRWIANHVWFPLNYRANGVRTSIKTENNFLRKYEVIFSLKVRNAIEAQTPENLFKNDHGIMVGNGELWFDRFRNPSLPKGRWKYGILGINN